ncbi:MAG: hypothetical protein GWN67_08075 [Phycisphaerae bacterium]|nr:hypothetical protein [Phycisphaerae bacterium]NIP51957.1 hypothetical protein [Phycisphaerae bacterium]NIS51078.1 hypothetical protein [Phycisphaerae bacterium]NIU08702.1 hypothetical protein [Phycisphaerae bacterium]NIU56333.1 hypothetical protein [Phycisphaerae bacterium]
MKRFRQFPAWKDKNGNDLALAIWKYLSGYETGLYHFNEILEGEDSFDEYATVRDPLKILNVYNMAYCGIFGPVLDGIFQGVGFETGRSFGVELWNHCATEVWYGNSWHYFDLDVRGVLLNADGTVASLDEARRNRDLWLNPQIKPEPFFPKDNDKNKVFKIYHDSKIHYYYRWFEGSHTMDFYLRQGETFTRWWTPQGGRWHHLPRYNKTKWIKDLIQTKPRGMKPNHRDFTCWNHGNGLFHYAPDLSNKSTDFEDGVYAVKNLTPGKEGLNIIRNGRSEVIFEIFTPYIIVAKVNDLNDVNDDTEASVVTLKAGLPIDLFISLDHGLSWQAAGHAKPGVMTSIDLTTFGKGTYGYLLKLSTSGAEGEQAVKSLTIDTWVQVAPISLPRLRKGTNHLKYETGDSYGLSTVPLLVQPNTAEPSDLKKYLVDMPKDYDPKRDTCRIRGDAVLRLAAPADTKIAWLSVGATFRTYQGKQAGKTDNRIAYAVGEPKGFKEIYKSSVPTWVNHWRYNWDTDILLDKPAEVIYVKYTGNPGLNVIRACLHLVDNRPAQTRIRVVHGYMIDGLPHQKAINLAQPTSYTVTCDSEPENTFIEIGIPSN